jgi:hypothetical protein
MVIRSASRGRMEEIVIRHGCKEGPRNPSLSDVERALDDIETGLDRRPEFSIGCVSNWKPTVVDGREATWMVLEGRYITIARFYPDDDAARQGWSVVFHEEEDSYALASDNRPDAPFVEGVCHGGPLAIRANCIVSSELALAAVEPYLSRRERCASSNWLPESQVYRHG